MAVEHWESVVPICRLLFVVECVVVEFAMPLFVFSWLLMWLSWGSFLVFCTFFLLFYWDVYSKKKNNSAVVANSCTTTKLLMLVCVSPRLVEWPHAMLHVLVTDAQDSPYPCRTHVTIEHYYLNELRFGTKVLKCGTYVPKWWYTKPNRALCMNPSPPPIELCQGPPYIFRTTIIQCQFGSSGSL